MGATVNVKGSERTRPTELFIVVVLEAFAGVRYILDLIVYPSFDFTWILLFALMLVSFLVAYGLWRFAKWAWIISFILSIFGVVSTISLLAIGGATESLLIQSIPSIIIDLIVIILLLMRSVRGLFWGRRAEKAMLASTLAQNP